MKFLINLLMICLSLTPFCSQTKTKEIQIQKQKNPREINQVINGKRFFVNDSSLYSSRFIKELRETCMGTTDSLILTNDTLLVYVTTRYREKISHNLHQKNLPNVLTIGKPVNYTTENNGKKYSLTLLRTNLTDIKFNLNIDSHLTKSGVTILGGTFYFGAECGFIDENGKEYCSAQYLSDNYFENPTKDSRVRINVQYGSGDHVSYDEYFSNNKDQNVKIVLRRQK